VPPKRATPGSASWGRGRRALRSPSGVKATLARRRAREGILTGRAQGRDGQTPKATFKVYGPRVVASGPQSGTAANRRPTRRHTQSVQFRAWRDLQTRSDNFVTTTHARKAHIRPLATGESMRYDRCSQIVRNVFASCSQIVHGSRIAAPQEGAVVAKVSSCHTNNQSQKSKETETR
jgi:hypothetical protein